MVFCIAQVLPPLGDGPPDSFFEPLFRVSIELRKLLTHMRNVELTHERLTASRCLGETISSGRIANHHRQAEKTSDDIFDIFEKLQRFAEVIRLIIAKLIGLIMHSITIAGRVLFTVILWLNGWPDGGLGCWF
jgi:hypothetical protein